MSEVYCRNCRVALDATLLVDIKSLSDGKLHLARFKVCGMPILTAKGLRDFFARLKAHFPDLLIHAVYPKSEWHGYEVQASHPSFPVSRGDAFKIPEVKLLERWEGKGDGKYVVSSMEFRDV